MLFKFDSIIMTGMIGIYVSSIIEITGSDFDIELELEGRLAAAGKAGFQMTTAVTVTCDTGKLEPAASLPVHTGTRRSRSDPH